MNKLKISFLVIAAALFIVSGCKEKEEDTYGVVVLAEGCGPTTTYDFPAQKSSNYAPVTPLSVTILNIGNQPTGKLRIGLSGDGSGDFEVSVAEIEDIAAGKSVKFEVNPKLGLPEETTYRATVSVIGGKNIGAKSFDVRFVMTSMNITDIKITPWPPLKTVFGIGETPDVENWKVEVFDGDDEVWYPYKLDLVEKEEVKYDFSTRGVKKVRVEVGMARTLEFNATALSLVERINALKGKNVPPAKTTDPAIPDTIFIYSNESFSTARADGNDNDLNRIELNVENTNIVLTTPKGVTQDRVLKKNVRGGYIFYMDGQGTGGVGKNVKLTLDGNVVLKGFATATYGGSDNDNNSAQLIRMVNGAVMEMKGNSKITGNVLYSTNTDATQGGSIWMGNSTFIMDEKSQITNCMLVKELPESHTQTLGSPVIYGGIFFAEGDDSKFIVRGNAKITNNKIIGVRNNNAYATVGYTNGARTEIIIEGNAEISNNTAESRDNVAAGGAFAMLTGSPLRIKGGVIKNNTTIYKNASRGGAIATGNSGVVLHLTGHVCIPAGGAITESGGIKTDPSNCIGIYSGNWITIEPPFSVCSPIIIDLTEDLLNGVPFNFNIPILKKRIEKKNDKQEVTGYDTVDFDGDAPAEMFVLRNKVDWRTPFTVTPLTNYKINENGYVVLK